MTRLVLSGFELDNIFVKLALLGIGLFFASYAVLFIIKACIHIFQGGRLAFHAYKNNEEVVHSFLGKVSETIKNIFYVAGAIIFRILKIVIIIGLIKFVIYLGIHS